VVVYSSNVTRAIYWAVGAALRIVSNIKGLQPAVVTKPTGGEVDVALSAVAVAAKPISTVEAAPQIASLQTASVAALPKAAGSGSSLPRHRPSMLAARLHCVAKLNVVQGRKPFMRGRHAMKSKPASIMPIAVKRSPTLVAIKRKSVVAKKAVTRIITSKPIRHSAVIVRLPTKTPLASVPRLKRAA
jgi:hypothetical protein